MKKTRLFGGLWTALLCFMTLFGVPAARAAPRMTPELLFYENVVDWALDSAGALAAADMDGDGDLDIAGAISDSGDKLAWWENDGTPAGPDWTRHDIGTATTAVSDMAAVDLDGDLDVDVVWSSSDGAALAWFENSNGGWPRHEIDSGASEAFSTLAAADLDGDLDLDVAVNTGGSLKWYENDGAPAAGDWASHLVAADCDECNSLRAADLNGDGRPDLLVTADDDNLQDNDTLFFYINNGNKTWTRHVLEKTLQMWQAEAGDLDGDGDVDVAAARENGGLYAWINNGGAGSTWTYRPITAPFGLPGALHMVDLDRDGDLDILASSALVSEIVWFENDGTPWNGAWPWHMIENAYASPGCIWPVDLDADGDWDFIGQTEEGVSWWEGVVVYNVYLPALLSP